MNHDKTVDSNKDITTCGFCNTNNKTDSELLFIRNAEDKSNSVCEECIGLMNRQINQRRNIPTQDMFPNTTIISSLQKTVAPSAKNIYNHLNKHVIGQDSAKKQISVAISHHFKRIEDPTIGKSNVLLIGPTGTGKTEIARAVSSYLNIPFAVADATSLTTRGYVGEDVTSVISRLLYSCGNDVQKAERGIIFLDEVDKIASVHNRDSQISTVSVQQELLKLIEGTTVKIEVASNIPGERNKVVHVNTKNILFICAGAFSGLSKMVQKPLEKSLGIAANPVLEIVDNTGWEQKLESKHLIEYGLIPEFLGRLPVVVHTQELSKEDYFKILTAPENSIINQYLKIIKSYDVEAEFSPALLDSFVEAVVSKDLGARGIRKLIEDQLSDFFFSIEDYAGQRVLIEPSQISVISDARKKAS